MEELQTSTGPWLPWLFACLALAGGAGGFFAGRTATGAGMQRPAQVGLAAGKVESPASPGVAPLAPDELPPGELLASSTDPRGHLWVEGGGTPAMNPPLPALPSVKADALPARGSAPRPERWRRSRAALAFPLEDQRGPMPLSVWIADRSGAPLWPVGEPFVGDGPVAEAKGWNPSEAREALIDLVPEGALETVTRPFVERRIQVRVRHAEAFVTVRIPID